ncbi:hypothetical protein E3T26_08630 [Cryobacterium sp. TMT1-21]|uniref:hypothetical protein n=1 Tax=Cryobacterium sp. TMT1-21 TaxID=1259234 RepID=UPI00106A146B|nr:hypothetical protein [Cryobacterium sp. TMT1-21]TFD14179.1 hypothetical protein E3T26_08630 [Cryobacterium sp. TMT1-21]
MANNINIVITAEDKASKPIRSISDEMDGASGKSNKFKSALGSLGGVLKTTAIAGGIAAAAFAGTSAAIGFNFNSSVEQAQTKLQAFMQDNARVAKTLQWVKEEAAATQFSFTDMADAAANLTPVSKLTGTALEALVKQAEILAAVNPAEGLTGATFSLREALSGDWVSIVDRFNLPRKRINELKAQGVPAMEIISKTLGEMGINYDLVSKQGKTTAARFDQVKDKLTMMAGAAAKPIFDRVSSELGKLGEFNFEALGDQLAGVASGALKAFDEFIPRVQEVASQIGEYLSPKIQTLWETVQTKLMPALEKLWKEVLQPLIPVIGELLVGAVGGLIDALDWALRVLSPLITFMANNTGTVVGFALAFGAIKLAMEFGDIVTKFQGNMTLAKDSVQGVINKVTDADGKLTKFAGWASFAGLAAIALGVILDDVKRVHAELDTLDAGLKSRQDETAKLKKQWQDGIITKDQYVKALSEAATADQKAQKSAKATADKYDLGRYFLESLPFGIGTANKIGNSAKGHASGTNASPGGWRLVGEHGPEPVYLPQGAQVTPAYQARSQGGTGSSGGHTVLANVTINNGGDYHRMLNDIGFALELAS